MAGFELSRHTSAARARLWAGARARPAEDLHPAAHRHDRGQALRAEPREGAHEAPSCQGEGRRGEHERGMRAEDGAWATPTFARSPIVRDLPALREEST